MTGTGAASDGQVAPDSADEQLVCSSCAATGGSAAIATWSRSLDCGVVHHYCPACSRQHARSIEAKLDPRYW